jgi:hypothetical protein
MSVSLISKPRLCQRIGFADIAKRQLQNGMQIDGD